MGLAERLHSPETVQRRKIALDIDDTIIKQITPLNRYRNAVKNSSFSVADYRTYELHKVWGETKEETDSFLMQFSRTHPFIYPILRRGAREAILRLSENNDLHIVTARNESLKDATIEALEREFPGVFSKYIFTSTIMPDGTVLSIPKSKVCADEGIGLIVDDAPHHAIACAEVGIDVLMFDQTWNHGLKHPKIRRIFRWDEVTRFVESLPPMYH